MALRWSESMALGRPAQTSIAGAESNVAICLARLDHSVSFVGRVGDDQPGELVMRTLRAERVGTEHVFRDADAGTGVILFDRPVAGSVNVTYRRRGSAGSRLQPADIAAALENPPRILHLPGSHSPWVATAPTRSHGPSGRLVRPAASWPSMSTSDPPSGRRRPPLRLWPGCAARSTSRSALQRNSH